MNYEQFQEAMKLMKEEIIQAIETKLDKKLEDTLDRMNKKVNDNEADIREINEDNKEIKDKLTELTARVNVDNESVVDNTERLDKVDRTLKLMELRCKETEGQVTEIMTDSVNSPRLVNLEREITSLKQIISDDKNIGEKEKNEKSMKKYSDTTPTKKSINILKSSSPNLDNFKDARGKVGLFPISIDDIKQHVKDDADDISIMTKYEYIEARNKAAQHFLVNNMHFQEEEIKIFTLKMAAN